MSLCWRLKHISVQRLLDTLACDEAEVRRRLVELTRTITVLRVNEKTLARKYLIAQQTETGLRQVMMHFQFNSFIECCNHQISWLYIHNKM